MKKLISMTDFIIEASKELHAYTENYDRNEMLHKIINYCNFLKQPLTLGMFVSCDLDGNVLEEPKNYIRWIKKELNTPYDLDLLKYEEYQESKERVLFEGWKFELKNIVDNDFNSIFFEDKVRYYNGKDVIIINCIEDLIKCDIAYNLTKSAKKQTGLTN